MSLENWKNNFSRPIERQRINNFLEDLLNLDIELENENFYVPDVEVKETSKAFCLKIEIPGIIKEQISIELNNSAVRVRGKRTLEEIDKAEKLIYSDLRYGKWQRIISLPKPITAEGISAEYAYGILKLVVYKQSTVY